MIFQEIQAGDFQLLSSFYNPECNKPVQIRNLKKYKKAGKVNKRLVIKMGISTSKLIFAWRKRLGKYMVYLALKF